MTDFPLPGTILVCGSKALNRNLQKYIQAQMEEYYEDDLVIEVTNKGEVLSMLDVKRKPETP